MKISKPAHESLKRPSKCLKRARAGLFVWGDIAAAAGISRQAVYLHFASRTELLVAATKHVDEVLDSDRRLAPSREATCGVKRLDLYIESWGRYIPQIYRVAKGLMLAQDTDEAAAAAWKDRMLAMRDGCRAAIEALHADGNLASEWTPKRATDALWTMLLVPNWENLHRMRLVDATVHSLDEDAGDKNVCCRVRVRLF